MGAFVSDLFLYSTPTRLWVVWYNKFVMAFVTEKKIFEYVRERSSSCASLQHNKIKTLKNSSLGSSDLHQKTFLKTIGNTATNCCKHGNIRNRLDMISEFPKG